MTVIQSGETRKLVTSVAQLINVSALKCKSLSPTTSEKANGVAAAPKFISLMAQLLRGPESEISNTIKQTLGGYIFNLTRFLTPVQKGTT